MVMMMMMIIMMMLMRYLMVLDGVRDDYNYVGLSYGNHQDLFWPKQAALPTTRIISMMMT